MRGLTICVLCLQVAWTYGFPRSQGVGAFAYSDGSGNRYGGTYELKDGKVTRTSGDAPNFRAGEPPVFDFVPPNFEEPPFQPPFFGADFADPFVGGFDADEFFPAFFKNLQNLLRETFESNKKNQMLAFDAAQKAFDLTSNRASEDRNLMFRFGFPGSGMSPNSAVASAAAGPGYSHQAGAINPPNPNMRNYNEFQRTGNNNGGPGFYQVSSSSYASSSNVDGQERSSKGAKTYVNNNGQVSEYSVQS